MSFPTNLSNAVDGVTEIIAAHLNNLEAKVGIDSSTVVTSLDYLLKNTGSTDPGHKHTAGAFSGGNNGDVFYKAAGAWGPGTPEAAGLVAKSGDQSITGVKTFTSIPLGPASNPTTDNQLARKAYVDLMLPLAGGTMAGNIAMNNHKATGLAAASGAGEAVRYDEWIAAQDPGHKHSKLWASDGSPEAVTVDATGKVGIGITIPLYPLHIYNTAANILFLERYSNTSIPNVLTLYHNKSAAAANNEGPAFSFYSNNSNAAAVSNCLIAGILENVTAGSETGALAVYTRTNTSQITEKFRITGTGNVGIGIASPGKKLDVNGYARGVGIFNTLNSAPADGDLAAGECAWWFDKTDGAAKFMIKAKQNDGTVKTAAISLS